MNIHKTIILLLALGILLCSPSFAGEPIFTNKDGTHIFDPNPTASVIFYDEHEEVGVLSWENGHFTFKGKAEESARVFFDFLKPLINAWIEKNCQKGSRYGH